jgi:hypothetical protein
MTNQEHKTLTGRSLEVHRLVPGSVYAKDTCVTLCRACHGPQPRSPRGSYPDGTATVSISPELHRVLRTVAAWRGVSVADYLSEITGPVARRHLAQMNKEATDQASEKEEK